MKTFFVVALLFAAGCGEPSPSDRLQGTWFVPSSNQCGPAVTFMDDRFQFAIVCLTSSTSAVADIEQGTFSASGTTVDVSMTRASCPATADRSLSLAYKFSGDTLIFTEPTGLLSLTRDTAPAGSFNIQFGCIDDAGKFTPGPIVDL